MKFIHKVTKDKEGTYYTVGFAVPEGVEVKYTVDFEYSGEKLLFGDLHIHNE